MKKAFVTAGMQDFFDQLEAWQREDSPWIYEASPADLPRVPVRGKGGRPTGEYLPTGKESLKQLEIQMGRKMTPPGVNPLAAGKQVPASSDRDEDRRRQHQVSTNAILKPLDAVATAMERKWGVGRLQTLVPEEWAWKFQSAGEKLNSAIDSGDQAQVRERAEVMRRGWQKLDELAAAAGHEPWVAPDVWEVRSPKGRIYAIARTAVDEANSERAEDVRTITLAEVAMILDAWDQDGMVTELRAEFPGSRIVKAGRPVIDTGDDSSADA